MGIGRNPNLQSLLKCDNKRKVQNELLNKLLNFIFKRN